MVKKENIKFGRIPSPLDMRDYNVRNFMPKKAPFTVIGSKKWDFIGEPLDQEASGHCVGFSMANFGINLPVNTPYGNKDGHSFYYACKIVDGEPNEENGSYIRTAAKVLKNRNIISTYAFAYDIYAIKWWILNKSPMIIGTVWTEEMLNPKSDNTISVGGSILGGHAYLLNEWREDNYIGIQNSWGNNWGINGKAYIKASDFEKIFKYDGEAMTAVEIETSAIGKPCPLAEIIKNIFRK